MRKFNLLCLLILSVLTFKSQNLISKKCNLEWATYYCGNASRIVTTSDTLVVSPNPFDSIAVIEFTISNNDSIWLDIYNITGNTIKSYYNGAVLASGSYTLNFNGDTLPNGIYFIRLKNNSITIQTVKLIKSSNAVGLKENSLIENVNIFPNPTSSIINIIDEQNQFQSANIEITDYLGQTIYSAPFTTQINMSDFSSGMYFLTIQNEYISKSVKVIKQ